MPNEPKPQGRQAANPGRRRLWKRLLSEVAVVQEEFRGHRHLALADLGRMPDHVLAEVVPVFRRDGGFRLEGDRLFAGADDPAQRHCIRECTAAETHALQQFASGTRLGDIGEELEDRFRLPRGNGFALVKDLFLELASRMVCHPAGPTEV
jgi:hypothetical protein